MSPLVRRSATAVLAASDGQATAVVAGETRIFATESSAASDGYGSIRVSAPAATPTRSSPAASN